MSNKNAYLWLFLKKKMPLIGITICRLFVFFCYLYKCHCSMFFWLCHYIGMHCSSSKKHKYYFQKFKMNGFSFSSIVLQILMWYYVQLEKFRFFLLFTTFNPKFSVSIARFFVTLSIRSIVKFTKYHKVIEQCSDHLKMFMFKTEMSKLIYNYLNTWIIYWFIAECSPF